MVSLLAWAMLYGTLADLGFAWLTAGPPTVPSDPGYWAGIVYLALIGSVVTFPLHYGLVREIGAGRTAYNSILTISVAMLLSTLFEDYRWTWLTASGMALAVIGMMLALPWSVIPVLCVTLLLGTAVLSLLGAIGAALTVGLKGGGSMLLALLILPLYIPVLILGTGTMDAALQGLPVQGYLLWMSCLAVLALSLSPLAIAAGLRIGVSE